MVGSLVSAGAQIGSSLISPSIQGGFSLIQQDKQHAHDRRMQERQWMLNRYDTQDERIYNTYMANTAYQRTIKDLRKAGLNPILMFGGASPSHYSGNSARSVSAPSTSAGGGISGFNLLGGLESISNLKVNSALENKYNAEAERAKADSLKIATENKWLSNPEVQALKKRSLDQQGTKNIWQSYGDVSSPALGEKLGKAIGNFLFNSNSAHSLINSNNKLNGSGQKGYSQPLIIRKSAP